MQESTPRESRDRMIKTIRNALIRKTPNPYPKLDFESSVYQEGNEVPELIFAQRLSEAGGNFIFCENKIEFADSLLNLSSQKKWKNIACPEKTISAFLNEIEFPHRSNPEWQGAEAVITSCECLVVRSGSILVSSSNKYGRILPFFTPAHIVYATVSQLVPDLKDALALMKKKYKSNTPSSMTFITGPGKTSGIENITVAGAQGPGELFLFLVDES